MVNMKGIKEKKEAVFQAGCRFFW